MNIKIIEVSVQSAQSMCSLL